jgi:hypothetical protein
VPVRAAAKPGADHRLQFIEDLIAGLSLVALLPSLIVDVVVISGLLNREGRSQSRLAADAHGRGAAGRAAEA